MLTLEELLALWNDEATRATMTAAQISDLLTRLGEHTTELLAGDLTDDVLAELDAMAAIAEEARPVLDERTAAEAQAQAVADAEQAERAQRAQQLAERIIVDQDDEPEGDPAGDETPPAEVEPEPEATETQPIAATATPAAPAPRVTRVAARRPAAAATPPAPPERQFSLVAAAGLESAGLDAGQPLNDPRTLAAAFVTAWEESRGYSGPRRKIRVARAGSERAHEVYGEDRFLGRDPRVNQERIDAVTSRQAIAAAGGRCAPSPVTYGQPIIPATDRRPFRDDGLVRFGADRGGVVTLGVPSLADVDDPGAFSVWTMENDVNPTDPTTKPCLTIVCPDDDETVVAALTKCARIGNFQALYFEERIEAWLTLVDALHARKAERRLLGQVADGSTDVAVGQILGTARSVLAGLDRALPAFRQRHRTEPNFPLHWSAPFWLRDQIRADIARQIPVGTLDETLALADATIERWFAVRNVNTTWLLDGETGQEFGPQSDGTLQGWPSTVVTYLYPEGHWLFLDGGSLDFGIMRSPETTETNDFVIFGETMEAAHPHGTESQRLVFDTCPDGSVSATVDIDPCGIGS